MKKKKLMMVMMAVSLALGAFLIPSVTVKAADVATGTVVEAQDNLIIKDMKADKASPQNIGNTITVKADTEASEGEKVTYKYIIVKDSDSSLAFSKGYSIKNYILWTPQEEGSYTINCLAKDSKGKVVKSSIKYVVVDKELEIENFESSADSCNVSDNVKFNATVKGEGTLTYKYLIIKNDELSYSTGFRKNSSVNWTPSEEGTYTVYCKVRDTYGNERITSKNIVVNKKTDMSKVNCSLNLDSSTALKGEYQITNAGIENLDLTKLKVKLYFKYDADDNDPLVTSLYYAGIKYSVAPYYEIYQNDVTSEVTKEGDYSCVTFSFNRAVDMPINSEILYLQFAVNQTSWKELSNLSDVHTVLEYED